MRWFSSFFFALSVFAAPASAQTARSVAVTFDDLPASSTPNVLCDLAGAHDFTVRLLAAIAAESMPAAGFVNEGRVCEAHRNEILLDVLGQWVSAGHTLGNHTATHPDLNQTPLADYFADIVAGEPMTRAALDVRGGELVYFRHPQLHAGADAATRAALTAFLEERGYRVAPVTIDNQEWVFAAAYAEAQQRDDDALMQRILDAYTPYMDSVFAFFEERARVVVGYEPPQVLLLHANELNIAALPALAAMMRSRGYRFVSLDEAMADDAYALADGYVGPRGLSWLHRWGLARGFPFVEEPREPGWIADAAD